MSRINGQMDVFGEINLSIENFTKNAEKFEIFWKKDGQISQKINKKKFLPTFFRL